MEVFGFFAVFLVHFVTVGHGFLLERSTPMAQIQSTPDRSYAVLLEFLTDEKKHRMALEQRVHTLEQQTGYKEQNHKLEQMSNYVLQLENGIQSLKMEVEQKMSKNETIDSVARAHILDLSSLIESKFQALNNQDNDLLTKHQTIERTVTDLQKNITEIVHLKGIDQIQLLDTLRQRVDSMDRKSNMIISNANARSQDFLALYNKTTFVETNLQSKILMIENNLTTTSKDLSLQIHNLSNEVERNQNISTMNLSTHIAKEATSLQKLSKEQIIAKQKINDSLSQIDIRIDQVNQDLNDTTKVLKSSTKKVALTACMTSDVTYNNGDFLHFASIRSIVGINRTTQFLSNERFVCQDPGLYLMTATVTTRKSETSRIEFFRNNMTICELYDDNNNVGAHTSTGTATVKVNQNDTLFFRNVYTNLLYGRNWSCMTIVKIA